MIKGEFSGPRPAVRIVEGKDHLMPRISSFMILSAPEQSVLRIRKQVPINRLPEFIGESFATLGASLNALGCTLSDIPFVAFEESEPGSLLVGVCFPLPAPLPDADAIEAVVLPAEKIVCCMYLGSYEGTMAVQEEMHAWIAQQGFAKPAVSYETYYNGHEFPEEHFLTKIAMPLQK